MAAKTQSSDPLSTFIGSCRDTAQSERGMAAFLMTWKESRKWPHEDIVQMVHKFEEYGYLDETWPIKAHTMVKVGDRIWLLRQGREPRGIFGAGHTTDIAERGDPGKGEIRWIVPVRFEAFVDPKQKMLISAKAVASILRPTQINHQASGCIVNDEQSAALEESLVTGPVTDLTGAADWTSMELCAIVSDYFTMLGKELEGKSYSKTEHRNTLRRLVQRSPGAIERKHQNISAVLQKLGLPWIKGYKPLRNFQNALVDVVEEQLGRDIEHLDQSIPPLPATPGIDFSSIFVAPPESLHRTNGQSINRVIRRFDPAARDEANRSLEKAGEQLILDLERHRLNKLGRSDLAEKVKWIAENVGAGLGYDIESFAEDGSRIFIEVKTTRGPIDTPFFLSENERCVAAEKGSTFLLYRLFDFGSDPRVYVLPGPLERGLSLEPINYRVWISRQREDTKTTR